MSGNLEGFWILDSFLCCPLPNLQIPDSESRIQNPDSRIRIQIQNPDYLRHASLDNRSLPNFRSLYFFGHIFIVLGFASPWISVALGMKPKEKDAKVTETQEIRGEQSNKINTRPKEE
jgi:hypothetical protein